MFGPVRFLAIALSAGIVLGGRLILPSSAAETPTRMVYRVEHSKYGEVGTYTNTVEKSADVTTVSTQGRIKVSVLGIPAYRQSFDRVERWKGPRLMNFHSVTMENGKRKDVNGAAEGEQFTLNTPAGMVVAPANVKVANPWSDAVLSADTILTPDEGRVEKVNANGGETVPITINGHTIDTRHYRIDRLDGKRYEVWLDGEGIPVRFADISPKETINFTLAECQGAAVCLSLNGQSLAKR